MPTDKLIDMPIPPGVTAQLSEQPPMPGLGRKRPWAGRRIGFVGSRAVHDLLRFEVETLILDPALAQAIIPSGLLDAIVLDGDSDEVSGAWRDGFFDFGRGEPAAQALVSLARAHRVPVVALLSGPASRVPLFLPLARAADCVVTTAQGAADALARHGIAAVLAPAATQTALYHGFAHMAAGNPARREVLSLDLVRAIADPKVAAFLTSLLPFRVRLCAVSQQVLQHTVKRLGNLADSVDGSLTSTQLQSALADHDILVQIARPGDDGADRQTALNAAAARCAVLVLGKLDADDPRHGFARVFEDASSLRADLSRLTMDPLRAELHRQNSWRLVHRQHCAHHLAQTLLDAAGTPAASRPRRASVIVPTLRPGFLARTLDAFRAQTYADKELIVVANTDDPSEWDAGAIDVQNGEQILFMSRAHAAGMAMNLGVQRASGDYVFRMDDDDHYGPTYLEDMMLAATALAADLMGKPPIFYHYQEEGLFLRHGTWSMRPSFYLSRHIGEREAGHMSGYTHVFRRALFDEGIRFDVLNPVAADAGFLAMARDRGDLLCASADALNAVIVRRASVGSHTWQNAMQSDDPALVPVGVPMELILDPRRV